jgi:hypothetical protein
MVAFIAQMQAVQLQGKDFSASLTADQRQKAKEYAAFTTGAAKQAFLDSLTPLQRSEYVDLGLMWQQLDATKKGLVADIGTYLQEVNQEQAPAAQKQANDLARLLMLYQLAQPPY